MMTIRLEKGLSVWKQEETSTPENHLTDAALYRLTAPNAFAGAGKDLKHLSLCPACLEKWADWRHARTAAETSGDEASGRHLSFGFLQAAASPGLDGGVSMHSRCGSYRLDILPEKDSPGQGLVVFEALSGTRQLENSRVTVHDRAGRLLLEGRLSEGRLARPIGDPGGYDLSTWTVSIEPGPIDGEGQK